MKKLKMLDLVQKNIMKFWSSKFSLKDTKEKPSEKTSPLDSPIFQIMKDDSISFLSSKGYNLEGLDKVGIEEVCIKFTKNTKRYNLNLLFWPIEDIAFLMYYNSETSDQAGVKVNNFYSDDFVDLEAVEKQLDRIHKCFQRGYRKGNS
jgi:hypothetical protein